MKKPRIIIADTDRNYIIPLQLKFVDAFFDKIDLEIITEQQYFDSLFSAPQTADVLVVSEDLYESSLNRHNIGNVFVMMEQLENEQTDELNINRLFKYTSVKEIFNEIVGKSSEALEINTNTKNEPQIILVYSACGGVGKTTIALGISACLTKGYKKVLYINAGRLQIFQQKLNNNSPITANDVYAKLAIPNNTVYQDIKHIIRKETFGYLPPFKAALMSLNIPYSIYEKIATSAKESQDYDYIVIDAESSFGDEAASLISISDKIMVITEQTYSSVFATNTLVANINGINSEKYFFICNKFDKNKDNALISPEITTKFTINDYIENIDSCDQESIDFLSKNSSLQRVAFLMI